MNQTDLEKLLLNTRDIVADNNKNMRERGEEFNLFSILDMESNETKTHSAMLVALLDPKGNHYQGEKFLNLFLNRIGYDYKDEKLKLVKVKAEHHLGKISNDFKSGGFIDILITFPSGNAIAIENKIYAGDQPKQMYRYSLFKGGLCSLYYLNLNGDNPSDDSLFTLVDDDYTIITYNDHIIKWLDDCLAIIDVGSMLGNAIKQYQILIKKLTNTMDNILEENLNNLIVNNLEEAKYIHSHYQKAVNSIREKFRKAVCDKLNEIGLEVAAYLRNDATHVYSQIWLSSPLLDEKEAWIGIESFSGKGHNNGRIFIGVFDKNNKYVPLRDGDYRLNSMWPVICDIKTPENNPLNLASMKILERLIRDSAYFEELVNAFGDQVKDFVTTYYNEIIGKG